MSKKSDVIEVNPAGVIDLDPDPSSAQEQLSDAIHQNLSNAAERVVHAAINYVHYLNEGEGNEVDEDNERYALESAVFSFLDADHIHDALVELHPASPSAKIKKPKRTKKNDRIPLVGPGVREDAVRA